MDHRIEQFHEYFQNDVSRADGCEVHHRASHKIGRPIGRGEPKPRFGEFHHSEWPKQTNLDRLLHLKTSLGDPVGLQNLQVQPEIQP